MNTVVSATRALSVAVLTLLAVCACGDKKAAAPAETTPAQTAAAPTAQPDAAASAANTAAPDAAAAPAQAPAAPAESVSETEDGDVAPASETAASTVQPMLKLGGAPAAAPTSSDFKEGANYVKLVPAQPTSVAPGKIEVVEIFWYGCPHCFALDPAIEAWRTKGKPAYVEFVRIPAMWNDATRLHARVFYTAELLGKLEELHTPIFRELNVNSNPFNTMDKIGKFFRDHGVGTDEFQKAWSSFAVENKMQKGDFLNRRYRIESVPTIVVNGKYKTDMGMAGGEPQVFKLIGELTASEHGG
jgi:thiol:disulfide interchange protein DsbA